MFWMLKYLLYATGTGISLTTGLTSYLAFLQPAFYFPKPTGESAVGTVTYHWIDTTRKKPIIENPAHPHKELMVQLWYPTKKSNDHENTKPTAPYAPYFIDYLKKNDKKFWLLVMARPMYTWATEDAPLIKNTKKLPVIIFSHGLGCIRNANTAHCEELASHGYIVVSVSHSCGCEVTQFPDGRIFCPPLEANVSENPLDHFKISDSEIEFWIDDIQMVLDKLEHLNNNEKSQFYQRLDMSNIGMFGHSYGGATAAQLCCHDPRIKAGVNMDGALWGARDVTQLNRPFMFLCARPLILEALKKSNMKKEYIEDFYNALNKRCSYTINMTMQKAKCDIYKITLNDAGHMAFSDMALIKEGALFARPLQNLGAGEINGYRATEIINNHLVSFFDKYLKGIPSEIPDGNQKKAYPEVTYEKNTKT